VLSLSDVSLLFLHSLSQFQVSAGFHSFVQISVFCVALLFFLTDFVQWLLVAMSVAHFLCVYLGLNRAKYG